MEAYSTEAYPVQILKIENVTHNVKRFTLSKPGTYEFIPGQATDVVIDEPGWTTERRPFTFTSLNGWDTLEFTIKIYDDHHGVTNELGKLNPGDKLILHDVWGAIQYKGEGVFIAGGAGVTPFIAILRKLYHDHRIGDNLLIFSNRTAADIILKDEFRQMLGDRFINTITGEKTDEYDNRRIDKAYLKEKTGGNLDRYFYICGPDAMVDDIRRDLLALGVKEEMIVTEEF